MRLFIYLISISLIVPPAFADEASAEFSILASQYVQGKLTAPQVERRIKNRLPTAIPVFIETIQGSAETSARQQKLLVDLSQSIRGRSTTVEKLGMAASLATFALLEAALVLSGYQDMANDSFYLRNPDLLNQWIELRAIAFAPAASALSIPVGLIPRRGQTARNNAVSALDQCAFWLSNETFLSETP